MTNEAAQAGHAPLYRMTSDLPHNAVMDELRKLPRWVAWTYEFKGVRLTKVPKNPATGRNASVDDPLTWSGYEQARAAQIKHDFAGVGVVLIEGDDLCGGDLDHCLDWCGDLPKETYWEYSPSGEGIRVLFRGYPETLKCTPAGVEIYKQGRFLTITGNHVEGSPLEINEAPATLVALAARVAAYKAANKPAQRLSERASAAISPPVGGRARTDTGREKSTFWRAVNDAAMDAQDRWSSALFPTAKKHATGGWRVTSHDLGRDLEEDISIHPDGIWDFGTEESKTPIDLVKEWRGGDAKNAAFWLCERLGVDPATLGWNGRPAAWQTGSAGGGDAVASDPDPVDLWGSFDPPELPQGLLPPIIEDFARVNGDQMGADPAGLAVAALVTCAAAIPDRVQIKVKRHADWCESARLWAALIGPPSAKKSPIISAATGPLCRLDVEMMRDWQARTAHYLSLPKEERLGPPPPQTRLRIEDATVEAAQQVLEGSPWGVLLLQDELSGFFGAMDKYNGNKGAQADRAFWLRSFNGGQFALNRVGRGAAIIDNLSVSMLGGIQPEPLRKVAGDSVDDGLLQRLFPIMLRTATMGRDEPMPAVNSEYQFLIEGLRDLVPPGFLGAGTLVFDEGAQRIRRELEAKHLDLQSMETVNRKLASHIGKYDGLFARLCVVWHCIEHVSAVNCFLCDLGDLPEIVTEATAQRVADFLHRFLLAHAVAFYSGVLGLSDDHDRLTAIAGYILTHRLDQITNRDVQRGDRTMRGLRDHEIRPLLEQLNALGWLDRIDPPRPSSPPHWRVNPTVHTKFADRAAREAHRRQDARATIQRLVQP